MGTPVHAIQVESLFFLNKETKSSLEMPNVKLTYFNLRGRGEPCRIMLAYGGIKYEDERIPPPWDPDETARHAASVGGGNGTGVDAGFENRGGLNCVPIQLLGCGWRRLFLGVRAEWETGRVGEWLCST